MEKKKIVLELDAEEAEALMYGSQNYQCELEKGFRNSKDMTSQDLLDLANIHLTADNVAQKIHDMFKKEFPDNV